MPGNFLSPLGDLETIYVDDYALIDQYAKTGSLWMWGLGTSGQLGNNSTSINNSIPLQTSSTGTNWSQISCNIAASGAIKTDGTLWMWGRNTTWGQLGTSDTTNRLTPVQTIAGGTNWRQVSVGGFHTAAIKTDGRLWLWGSNNFGQLGNNIGNASLHFSSPVQTIAGGTNWKQVSCGDQHTAAIKTDGTLWVWGENTTGTTGDNTTVSKSSPVQTISSGTDWKLLSCGGSSVAAIKTDGTLWVWGENDFGQLGDGTTVNKSSPIQTISGGTNWKAISMGVRLAAAIKTDGTLWIWGNNSSGELGDNTTVSKSSPIQTVSGGTNWKQVSCGINRTCAIKTDGSLWTWGDNSVVQLGDGSFVSKSSPIQTAAGGTNWKQVSGVNNHAGAIYFYDAGNLYPSA